mgnify:CR=1 FL=1
MSRRYLDPKNDVAFKKLFSNKERLISLLNAILKLSDGHKIIDLDYIPQEQMPLFKSGKRSIFYLKVRDEAGRWYIIEMQRTMKIDFIDRVQFYGSYAYVIQIEEGIAHHNLLPIVVISIIGERMFPDELPYINYHQLKETSTNKQYLFSLMYVFVELGKFDASKIDNDVDQWLHLLKCAHEENQPPESIDSSIILSAYNDLEQYNWTSEEHDAYVRTNLAMVKEEEELADSYEKGAAEGKVEGKAEGEVIGIEKTATNMLKEKLDIKLIASVTGLSKEEILKLQNKI